MFTGIIEEVGILSRVELKNGSCRLTIHAVKLLDDCKAGASISINGACLTVTQVYPDGFVADVMAETMRRTNLGRLKAGDKLNLERSLRLGDRIGGHMVAGHVDEVGTITNLRPEGIAILMTVGISPALMRYVAVRGSICVEGVSLTVTEVSNSSFQVSLIPFTKENTTLGLKRVGDSVNIEVDMLARYFERLINHGGESTSNIDQEFLRAHGFL